MALLPQGEHAGELARAPLQRPAPVAETLPADRPPQRTELGPRGTPDVVILGSDGLDERVILGTRIA